MKNKVLKRILSAILVIGMIAGGIGVRTFAEEESSMSSEIQIVEDGGKNYFLADGGEAGPENFDVWTSKTIAGTENEDEFEVTLQVGTTLKAIPNDAAVVLVMDTSGSMLKDASGYTWGRYGVLPSDGTKLRIDYAKEAAQEFAEQLAADSEGSRRMLSIVEFGNNAMTVLPWRNVSDNGALNEEVSEAISSVRVNFIYDNRNFWDEDWVEQSGIVLNIPGGGTQELKVENWSDEEYIHETKSFYEAVFTADDKFTEYKTTLVTEVVEGTEVSVCNHPECAEESTHTHCTYAGCTNPDTHKHCNICGVSDAEVPDHTHCTYDNCEESTQHEHCMYSICSNPAGHMHCERVGRCDVAHEHCKNIMAVCGEVVNELNADAHKHIVGCTVYGCQDTTKDHRHACINGAVWKDYSGYNQYVNMFYDMSYGSKNVLARCLNSDPNHTHDVYDCDSYYNGMFLDRIHQGWYYCCTNMEGGLMLARNLVNTGLDAGGAIEGIDDVYVVLLSDGGPTYHVNQTLIEKPYTEVDFLYGERGGGTKALWEDVVDIVEDSLTEGDGDIAIVDEIKEKAELYTILYGTVMNDKLGGEHILSGLTAKEWFTGTGTNYIDADMVFDSSKIDELNTVFADIKNRIDVLAKAWTVNELLTDDVTFIEFTEHGDYATMTPASGTDPATISWNLGAMEPEAGTGGMDDPFIYTLKYTVSLKSAKENVKEISLAYDAGNSEEGVLTGKDTVLQYFMIDKAQLDTLTPEEIEEKLRVALFEDTSVKGIYGDFEFVKKNGETGEIIEGVGFTLYDSENQVYGSEVFSDSEGKVAFHDIPKGVYALKETTVPIGMGAWEGMPVKVSWGIVSNVNGLAVPDYIINYPVAGILVIEKTLDSYNKSLGKASFVFQVDATVTNATTNAKENVYSDVVSMVFDKPGTQSIVVKDLPCGAEVTVTEVYTGASYKLTTDITKTAVIAGEDSEKPATVTFGNTYDGRMNSGNGLVNNFSFDSTIGSWVHKVLEALSF